MAHTHLHGPVMVVHCGRVHIVVKVRLHQAQLTVQSVD